jgi:dTDP-D-glucose 4,6-dehydratase
MFEVYPAHMQRLLITGGAGFIGSNLVHFFDEALNSSDHTIVFIILDSLTYAGSRENLSELINNSNYLGSRHNGVIVPGKVESKSSERITPCQDQIVIHRSYVKEL